MRRAHDKLVRLIALATEADATEPEQVAVAAIVGKLSTCVAGWQEVFKIADDATERGVEFTVTFDALWPFNGAKIMEDDGVVHTMTASST